MRSGSARLLTVGLALCLSATAVAAEPRVFDATVMATRVTLSFAGDGGAAADAEAVFAVFRRVEAVANEWRPASPLAVLNTQAGAGPVPVPAELCALLARSKALAAQTGGAFDPTWAALWGLWDFVAPSPVVPSATAIAERVARIDHLALSVDCESNTAALARPGMLVGLGGIAKGWALDSAASELAARGVTDWVLSAGGQVLSDGHNADGAPWTVGIRDPRGAPDDAFALVQVTGSVSTSGDYERFFVRDGVRYHHLLDPRTGRPARGLRSVTVIAPDAVTADALSTALMIMGYEAGSALLAELPGVQAVWVDARGGVTRTRGLDGHFQLVHAPSSPTVSATPAATP